MPANELNRLRALAELDVLDSLPEPAFDALAHAAAAVCGVPISLISLIDTDRQWFKANVGLDGVAQTSREVAFCDHAIHQDGIFEVSDASLDPRFADNPLVAGDPSIRFYAGATLRLVDGANVGTLCVIDRQPRQLDAQQRLVLSHLATAAVHALEGRRALLSERKLRTAALQAAAVLRNSVDPIITLSLDGLVTHWNRAAERLFGHDEAEMLGQPLTRLLPPSLDDSDANPHIAAVPASDPADRSRPQTTSSARHHILKRLDSAGVGLSYETTRLHRDGQGIAVSVSLAPITDDDGRVVGATEIVRDVRQQVAAARNLAESQDRLRRLYESTPAMLHSIDIEGRLLSVTDRWLQVLGYRRDEVLGQPMASYFTEASRQALLAALPQHRVTGRTDLVPHQMVCKSGQVIDVLASAVLETDGLGQPLRSIGVIEDVTERLRAERSLADKSRRLASIIEGTGAGTWEWNVHTGQAHINEQWAAIVGHSLAEFQPSTVRIWLEHTHPDDLMASNAHLKSHFAGKTESYSCEVRMRHRDGHWVWVLARGRVLTWLPNGKPEWMFGTHMDISARKAQEQALLKSQKLLNRTGEVAGVGGWELDLLSNALTWSAQTHRIHGVPLDFVPTLDSAINFCAPEARPLIQAAVESAMVSGQGWDLRLPFIQLDGQRIWVRAVGHAEFESGRPVRLLGTFQDITTLHELALQLEQQHELLRVTLQSIADAVITTDGGGQVTWLNPAAERMTGWPIAQARGRPVDEVFRIVSEGSRLPAQNPITVCLQERKSAGLDRDTLLIGRDGSEFGIEDSASPIRNERGDLLGAVLVFHDVTEQRRMSGEMHHRATHDALTGLVNRAECELRLRRVLTKAQEDGSAHAVLFIDLDQFKLVNDACGHAVGDQLLQQVSKLFGETVRARDTLARMGGDEFAVILEHCSAEQAQRVAQQICDRMDDFRFVHDQRRFRIGTSIGLVPIDDRWHTTAALIQAADSACYAAKEAGRNRVHAWFDTDHAICLRQGEMQWATRLEQALDDDRFALFAQRIVSLGDVVPGLYAEVLLRLIDDEGQLVLPGAFLPAAERFHLVSRIDRWVLRHAIALLQAMGNLSDINTLSINLSGQSVGDRAFHKHAIQILTQAGPTLCRCLCLEITETAAITHVADAGLFIEQARALGVRIALDDFGAGASSFGYLKNLNVDLLKIDGQFIRDLIDDPLDDAAVRCFVDVARVVGVKTVAEFVDRPELLARVREVGVDFAQGFLLHQPQAIEGMLGLAPRVQREARSPVAAV